jgi:hypothetical protein
MTSYVIANLVLSETDLGRLKVIPLESSNGVHMNTFQDMGKYIFAKE